MRCFPFACQSCVTHASLTSRPCLPLPMASGALAFLPEQLLWAETAAAPQAKGLSGLALICSRFHSSIMCK